MRPLFKTLATLLIISLVFLSIYQNCANNGSTPQNASQVPPPAGSAVSNAKIIQVNPIATSQVSGVPFNVHAITLDENAIPATDYNGPATISGVCDTGFTFKNGVLDAQVTVVGTGRVTVTVSSGTLTTMGSYSLNVAAANIAYSTLAVSGTPPSPRIFHTAIYDPNKNRMIVFGGRNGTLYNGTEYLNQIFGDTWSLDLQTNTWSKISPITLSPSGRFLHSAVYDSKSNRMIVYGGITGTSPTTGAAIISNETWAFDLTNDVWNLLSPINSPPSVLAGHAAVFDPVFDRMVLVGGMGEAPGTSSAWALMLGGSADGAWLPLPPGGPPGIGMHAAYSPTQKGMFYDLHFSLDLSALTSTAWTAGNVLFSQGIIYDPLNDQIVTSGGQTCDSYTLGNIAQPCMTSLSNTVTSRTSSYVITNLPGLAGHSAIYNPKTAQMILFGGETATLDTSNPNHNNWFNFLFYNDVRTVALPRYKCP